jgi:acetylornithine deacetylase/succinyl-diaminopimelate desuccinylase-like protein
MGGSEQTNVIPPEAWANLDVRLLPGGDPKAVLEAIRRVANDPNVTIQPLNAEFRVANYSPTKTRSSMRSVKFLGIIFRERRWFPISPADTPRTSAIGRWGSTLTASRHMPRRMRKGTLSMETTSVSGWKKCGGGRKFCLMWSHQWREHAKDSFPYAGIVRRPSFSHPLQYFSYCS